MVEHAVHALRTIGSQIRTLLLMADHCQQAAHPDRDQITAPTDGNPIHTVLASSELPCASVGNAHTIIIRRTSEQNLRQILNLCPIGDDLSRLTAQNGSINIGYLWSRSRNEGVFFTDHTDAAGSQRSDRQ